jgi:hypothetical protein
VQPKESLPAATVNSGFIRQETRVVRPAPAILGGISLFFDRSGPSTRRAVKKNVEETLKKHKRQKLAAICSCSIKRDKQALPVTKKIASLHRVHRRLRVTIGAHGVSPNPIDSPFQPYVLA